MNASDLLGEFRKSRSEKAFGELVRRYTSLVYSVAKRRLSNGSLAEEVTQTVFIRLAEAAPQLRGDAELTAWLHRTTVHASIDLWRVETRRRAREQQAAVMKLDADDTVAWNELSTVLDEALNELSDAERQTILLRFFEHKSMRELGVALGVSEDAAKMRVSRALDRLRSRVGVQGVACSAVALGTMLTNRAVEAAPSALIAALMCLSLRIPVGLGASAGFLGPLLNISRVKLATGVVATVLVGLATFFVLRPRDHASSDVVAYAAPTNSPPQTRPLATAPVADGFNEDGTPNPLKLLQAVARARRKISSGMMELQLSTDRFEPGRKEVRKRRLIIQFDGDRLRSESFAREYAYIPLAGDESAEAKESNRRADSMDREAAVRAGFLTAFDDHVVTASDGATLVRFRESNGAGGSTTVEDPAKGSANSAEYFFDVRCLGLSSFLSFGGTVENCLGYAEAKSVSLIAEDQVEGIPAWQVRVKTAYGGSRDFWIDMSQPDRVLKQAEGTDSVISKYDPANPRDSLPVELTTSSHGGANRYITRFVRSNTQLNVALDPVTFTLAGLGMPVGTPVTDIRNYRGLGYWTGAGLSEHPLRKGTEPQPLRDLAEMLAFLDGNPASSEAFEAAKWIMLNTPDGPEVEKAAGVILQEHLGNTNLLALCQGLERSRHRCSTNLLKALLSENPSVEVRAHACFLLAGIRKEEAKFGQNKKAAAEAERLFEQVVSEFGRAGLTGLDLSRKAIRELYEIRRVSIGSPAPETEGDDLDGQRINLRDYQGKVVVVFFWSSGYSEATEHRHLLERVAGKPVAFIGVSGDNQLSQAKEAVEKQRVSWPTIWDGHDRSIHEAWNVRQWLSTFVLDRNGVIRYRDVRGREINEAVEALLKE